MGEGFVVRSCNCSIISVTKKVFMTGKAMLTYLTMTNLASSKLPSEIACGSTVELFWERAPSTYTLTQTGKQGCFSHHNGTPNQTRDRTEWNLADDSPKESWVTVYKKKKKKTLALDTCTASYPFHTFGQTLPTLCMVCIKAFKDSPPDYFHG